MTACPYCKHVGNLNRHGFLRGYDEEHPQQRTVRGWRIYCSNRQRANGCGRTFSIYVASKVRRLLLTADALWKYLKQVVASGNKLQAFRKLNCQLSDSAPYRIWKRFLNAQSAIRTALAPLCPPPKVTSEHPAALTVAHLIAAFGDHHSPIARFQVKLQMSFM